MMMIGISFDQDNGAILFTEEVDHKPMGRVARMFKEASGEVLTTLIERDEVIHQFRASNPGESGLWGTWWCQRAV